MQGNKNTSCKSHALGINHISGYCSGKTFLGMALLSLLIACFWAVPAMASENVVTDTAAEAGVVASEETVSDTAVPAAEEASATGADETVGEVTEAAVEENGGSGEEAASAVIDPEGVVAAAGEDPITAAASPQAEEPCKDCAEDAAATPLEEDCEDVAVFLELICGEGEFGVYWASKEDYDNGLLSMEYRLRNTSTDTAVNNIRVVSATATNGVKVNDELPKPLGSLDPGDWMYFVLKWQVPKGVRNFVTDISICADCEQLCTDCDPEPVCEGPGCNPPIDEEEQPPVEQPLEPRQVTAVHASALPNTGFGMTAPIVFGLGLIMLGGLLPVVKKAYRRSR